MRLTNGLLAFFIISSVFIAQNNVFGGSFQEDSFDFERRAAVSNLVMEGESLIQNAATQDQVDQLVKLVPTCLALPDNTLQKLFEEFFATHPAPNRRRKRSFDFMRRFENDMDGNPNQESLDFGRRATDAEKKIIADDLNKFLSKMNKNHLAALTESVNHVEKAGTSAEHKFIQLVIEFSGECAKTHKARRLFELRRFLEDELMNEYK